MKRTGSEMAVAEASHLPGQAIEIQRRTLYCAVCEWRWTIRQFAQSVQNGSESGFPIGRRG